VPRSEAIGFAALGAGAGWLMGLSVSPVVASALSVILGASASLVAAYSSTKSESSRAASPWPLAIFVIGVAVGAPFGISFRDRQVFGATGIVTPGDTASSRVIRRGGGLHGAVSPGDCDRLRASSRESLGKAYRDSEEATLIAVGRFVSDVAVLDSIRRVVCEVP
jgi:hypothetical protein